MKIIITNEQYNLVKEYFDPLYYLKNLFRKDRDRPNDLETQDLQKIVDLIFKFTQKEYPVKEIKGLKIQSHWLSNTASMFEKYGFYVQKHHVTLDVILSKWFNPKDEKYLNDLEIFRKKFEQVRKNMGIGEPTSDLPFKINFYLN